MIETWRAVVGFEGAYEVSDLGRVRSLPGGQRHGCVLKPAQGRYLRVSLCVGGVGRMHYVHHLVAAAFIGPRPTGPNVDVCHNNGDAHNNRASNLRYATTSANNRDIALHGRHSEARRTHCDAGHEYTPENTYRRRKQGADGVEQYSRECRTCGRAARRAYYQRRRSALVAA